jgi:hypothetical protein
MYRSEVIYYALSHDFLQIRGCEGYVPKADGDQRSIGIPALEDKIVQGAVSEVLSAIYEAKHLC